jgi:hypothetical protein
VDVIDVAAESEGRLPNRSLNLKLQIRGRGVAIADDMAQHLKLRHREIGPRGNDHSTSQNDCD